MVYEVFILIGVIAAVLGAVWQARVSKARGIKFVVTQEELKKLVSHAKNSEVRVGKIGENMAPFFKEWPYDPKRFRFLGDPVDGIQFTDDEVVFVEIKTGKARLTSNQKRTKELVKEGKVKFATFRVGEDGCTLKVEE